MQKVTLAILVSVLLLSGCLNADRKSAAPEAAQQLLKLRGYDFDEKSFFAAAQARDMMAINAFFDAGINPNAQDGDGRTVLIAAAARGDLQVTNVLLARGVDPNVKDKRGYTAMSHAIEAMYEEVVDALLNDPKIDPNARGLNGRPALNAYVWRDDKARVEKLLARGADVNAQDNDGDTALIAVSTRISKGKTSTTSIAIFTSYDSIFLPRYSGVRPTINPAMNTASTTKISIP